MKLFAYFISIGWWECTQFGERLITNVIKICRWRVKFGGHTL